MGRPQKHNLNYFPLDVDFFEDHKILMIEEECGINGGYLAIRFLGMIYSNGYYLNWPEYMEVSCAKRVGNGITSALVVEVLNSCIKYELFDREIFEKYRVLTSKGIQKRWLEVMKLLRRKVHIPSEYLLIPSEDIPVSSEETTTGRTFSAQKEIKEKETKEKKVKGVSPLSEILEVNDAEAFILSNQLQFEKICMAARRSAADAKLSLRKFHLYLEEKGQYPKTKKSVFAGFEKWLLNEKKFENQAGDNSRTDKLTLQDLREQEYWEQKRKMNFL